MRQKRNLIFLCFTGMMCVFLWNCSSVEEQVNELMSQKGLTAGQQEKMLSLLKSHPEELLAAMDSFLKVKLEQWVQQKAQKGFYQFIKNVRLKMDEPLGYQELVDETKELGKSLVDAILSGQYKQGISIAVLSLLYKSERMEECCQYILDSIDGSPENHHWMFLLLAGEFPNHAIRDVEPRRLFYSAAFKHESTEVDLLAADLYEGGTMRTISFMNNDDHLYYIAMARLLAKAQDKILRMFQAMELVPNTGNYDLNDLYEILLLLLPYRCENKASTITQLSDILRSQQKAVVAHAFFATTAQILFNDRCHSDIAVKMAEVLYAGPSLTKAEIMKDSYSRLKITLMDTYTGRRIISGLETLLQLLPEFLKEDPKQELSLLQDYIKLVLDHLSLEKSPQDS